MFNEIFKQVTGIFDRRFLLNAFFPSLIFWVLLLLVGVFGGGWEFSVLLQAWNQQDAALKLISGFGVLSLIIFFASILFSDSYKILRFFEGYQEGYWRFPVSSSILDNGKIHHQIELDKLNVDARLESYGKEQREIMDRVQLTQDSQTKKRLERKINRLESKIINVQKDQFLLQEINYQFYPQPKHRNEVMPTRLGNILKNSEKYPLDRYEIDAVLLWSRLYHLFPERYMQIIGEARSALDFTLAIATLSGLFSLISGIYLVLIRAPGWLFLLCFWGGALLAWMAYESALGNAAAYAEQVKVGFDLYRRELVKQLHLEPARSLTDEKEQWLSIRRLLYEGEADPTWVYTEPSSQEEDD